MEKSPELEGAALAVAVFRISGGRDESLAPGESRNWSELERVAARRKVMAPDAV